MAKQNVISSGFYGKVGALVGQRWHNIRTVRSYVIPKNPRSPRQQANRGKFADTTRNAQIGQQMNYKAPIFKEIDNSEWAIRMATGLKLQENGQTGFNLIPLFPISYIPKYHINSIILESISSANITKFSVSGELPLNDRQISILLGTKKSEDEEYEITLYSSIFKADTVPYFELQVEDAGLLNSFTKFLIVSNDDSKNNNETLYASEQKLGEIQPITREFNTKIAGIERDSNNFLITFSEPFIDGNVEIGKMTAHGISKGEEVSFDFFPTQFIKNEGYFAVAFTQNTTEDAELLAFPSGSYLEISNIKVESPRLTLISNQKQENFSSTDLERVLQSVVQSVTDENGYLSIKFAESFFNDSWEFERTTANAFINASRTNFSANVTARTTIDKKTEFVINRNAYTNTAKPLFYSNSYINFGKVKTVKNGVTYYFDISNIIVEELDPHAPIDTTIKNVSRTDRTYIIVVNNPYIYRFAQEMEAEIFAVESGFFQTRNVKLTLFQSGTNLGLRFTIPESEDISVLPAFTTGSTIKIKNVGSRGSNLYYSGNESVQNYSNADLTRQFLSEINEDFTPQNDYEIVGFKQGATENGESNATAEVVKMSGYFAWEVDDIISNLETRGGKAILTINESLQTIQTAEYRMVGTSLKTISNGVTYKNGSVDVSFEGKALNPYFFTMSGSRIISNAYENYIEVNTEIDEMEEAVFQSDEEFRELCDFSVVGNLQNYNAEITDSTGAKQLSLEELVNVEWVDETHLKMIYKISGNVTNFQSGQIRRVSGINANLIISEKQYNIGLVGISI